MTTEKIMKSYTISELKKEISKRNIKGYSKMKRAELHSLIMKNKAKFSDLSEKVKTKTAKSAPKATKPKASKPKNMPQELSSKIKEFAVDKKDTEKRKIKISDIKYFTSKVRELLKRKLGNQPYLNGQGFKSFIDVVIRKEVKAKRSDYLPFVGNFFSEKYGLSRAALALAMILASKKYGLGSWKATTNKERESLLLDSSENKQDRTFMFHETGPKEPLIKLILTSNLEKWFPFEATKYISLTGNPKFYRTVAAFTGSKKLYMVYTSTQKNIYSGKEKKEPGKHIELGSQHGDDNIAEMVVSGFKVSTKKKYFDILLTTDDYDVSPYQGKQYLSLAQIMHNLNPYLSKSVKDKLFKY